MPPRIPRPYLPASAPCLRLHLNLGPRSGPSTTTSSFGSGLDEYESIESVSKIALGIAEHGAAFGAWAEYLGHDSWDDLDRFEDCYQGHWESLTDYAESLLGDLGLDEIIESAVPESLQPYVRIDADALARDMSYSGELYAVEGDDTGGVFLFGP